VDTATNRCSLLDGPKTRYHFSALITPGPHCSVSVGVPDSVLTGAINQLSWLLLYNKQRGRVVVLLIFLFFSSDDVIKCRIESSLTHAKLFHLVQFMVNTLTHQSDR
jgi:hypothetical protein